MRQVQNFYLRLFLFLAESFDSVGKLVKPVSVEELDHALVGSGSQLMVDGKLTEKGETVTLGNLGGLALAEEVELLSAVGTLGIAHILDQTEHGNVHELSHADGLLDDHRNKLLRRCDGDERVNGNGLEYGKRNIACSRGHIDKHKVDVVPYDLRPELLDNSADDGTSPYNGIGGVLKQKVDTHNLDTCLAVAGEETGVGACCSGGNAESAGNGRTCDVSVEDSDPVSASLEENSEKGSHHGLSDAALTAGDGNNFFNGRKFAQGIKLRSSCRS